MPYRMFGGLRNWAEAAAEARIGTGLCCGITAQDQEVVGLIETGHAACLGTRPLGVTADGFGSGVK